MATAPDRGWDELWQTVDSFRGAVGRYRAVNVNSQSLRDQAQQIVQCSFRDVRPDLSALGLHENSLDPADHSFQELLRLAQGRNAKRSYATVLRALSKARASIAAAREMRLSAQGKRGKGQPVETPHSLDPIDVHILQTLTQMLPSAGASYEQAARDVHDGGRVSLRGTAVELREALREVLDHLAPDSDVIKAPGFRLEPNQTKPTMRQKARFVLRSRGQPDTASQAPEDTVSVVEELVAALVRSVYQRGSLSTHVASARGQVTQLKMYVDSVLAELLQVHGEPNRPLNPTGAPAG